MNPTSFTDEGLERSDKRRIRQAKVEDQRVKDSNLILKKSFTVVGVVLVLLGFYALATITSLVRAYMAKLDAQNGGIV